MRETFMTSLRIRRLTYAALFLAGAVTNAVPGIILQLALIPLLVIAMERAGLSLNRR